MKITSINTHLMGIAGPGGHAPARNWIFVEIRTDEGISGIGEATTEYHEHAVAFDRPGSVAVFLHCVPNPIPIGPSSRSRFSMLCSRCLIGCPSEIVP